MLGRSRNRRCTLYRSLTRSEIARAALPSPKKSEPETHMILMFPFAR